MGMTSISPGGGLGGPSLGTGMLSADEARAYADWQNSGGQGDFQYTPGQNATQLNATDPNAQQMLPVAGLPSVGMGDGGKGVGGMLPGVIAGQTPQLPGLPQGGAPTLGTGMLPAEEARQYAQSQQANTPFPNQQQPITQGNGQLPPALMPLPGGGPIGAPPTQATVGTTSSPVPSMTPPRAMPRAQAVMSPPVNMAARNQFAPGMPGMGPQGGGRVTPAPRMNDLTYGAMQGRQAVVPTTNRQMTPLQQNRFAPPNAPGVRSTPITRPRVR